MTIENKCLQDKTGSCAGCDILLLVLKKLHRNGISRNKEKLNSIAREIQNEYCPEERALQTGTIEPEKRSIW